MASSPSAGSGLLDALHTVDGVDLIRESVRIVMQELIEAEARRHGMTPAIAAQRLGKGA